MPDGRFISKSISVSEQLGNVSLEADFLFGRCIPHLDVDGRITGNPKGLKAIVCPLRDELSHQKITHLLKELSEAGLVIWYEINGSRYLEFPNFGRHQKGMHRDREAVSKIPSSQSENVSLVFSQSAKPEDVIRTDSGVNPDLVHPKLSEVKLSEVKGTAPNGAAKAKYPSFPVPDSLRFHRTCVGNGFAVDHAILRKTLAPLYTSGSPPFSADEIDNALIAWLEAKGGQPPDKARFWTLTQFVQDTKRWVRLGGMPRTDENGVTERGRLAVGL